MEKQFWMYLSLWQEHDGAPGMGLFSLNADTGELKIAAKLDDRHSFGCSCYDARRSVLYVCNEVERIPGGKYLVCSCLVSGDIAVYAVEKNGRLSAPVSAARMKGCAYMSFCGQS